VIDVIDSVAGLTKSGSGTLVISGNNATGFTGIITGGASIALVGLSSDEFARTSGSAFLTGL
jgi:autotransporter-associated beta strand protein